MSELSEEQIINSIKPIVNARKTHKDNHLYNLQLNAYQLDAIQGLLDLYNKEKEKNKELEMQLEIEKIDNKYNQEERDEETIPRYKIIKKIQEKIKYTEHYIDSVDNDEGQAMYKILNELLQELLEERN